ncbi:hypothetical protein Mal64_28470 [Pseudobythopirellula maris]|uniref:Alpha/beta hydrolase family protein n=1 Tax=Pseudobythopirellula maris TaxID=2527991 RepID=A0A5C5ZIY5_9BACT|nr:peptidase [Pseudobythopirellula maris]TWT87309.1 hypothetical protein Mal64_28470 [Pseudobythopirellula maris]
MPRPILTSLFALLVVAAAQGATLQLKDGRTISGEVGHTTGVADDPFDPSPGAGAVPVTSTLIVDDGLRRTFLHKTAVRDILDGEDERQVKIRLWQNEADRGSAIGSVGQLVRLTPFDEFGRRIYEMRAAGGSLAVIQGVTEITPIYTRVEGLSAEPRSYVWDMRLATSSIPRDTLDRILRRALPQDDLDSRLQAVRLYLQGERYHDAQQELEAIRRDFPEAEGFEDDLRQLRQLAARRLIAELELRREAGQHRLVRRLLASFPPDGVAGATLRQVREMLDAYDNDDAKRREILGRLSRIVEGLSEPRARAVAGEILAEINAELSDVTLGRLTAFAELSKGSGSLSDEQLASLAISGWLLGTNQAVDNLQVALSLVRVRGLILEYLQCGDAGERERLLVDLRDAEGATVERVAELLRLMKPPLDILEAGPSEDDPSAKDQGAQQGAGAGVADITERGPGFYEIVRPLGDGHLRYLVQLPPEYDPLRSYPAIITLGGAGYRPETQLDYWAGAPAEGRAADGGALGRSGQSMRHGYIVVAVDWLGPQQSRYGFTSAEHLTVLAALRDARRRFAIDSDRVYLSGHDIGGDAAWDIGLAHPEHWAGVIPLLARADRYVGWYWKNAEFTPWYFVEGELDGGKVAASAREFDRYLRPRFDATLVEYLGRGHEAFSDEIQRLFDWMGRRRRGAAPEEFECFSLRPWDNYFWWVEAEGLPEKAMVAPAAWPPQRGVRAVPIRGRKYAGNKLGVFARTERVTVWLSPDLVSFDEPLEIELNGRRVTGRGDFVEPELGVLLEDARTRADRKHPYWAKVTAP